MDATGTIGRRAASDVVAHGDAASIAESLARDLTDAGADSLNLRVFGEDVPVEVLADQIGRFGGDVLPELRRAIGIPAASVGSPVLGL
jgi:hypothetical protein